MGGGWRIEEPTPYLIAGCGVDGGIFAIAASSEAIVGSVRLAINVSAVNAFPAGATLGLRRSVHIRALSITATVPSLVARDLLGCGAQHCYEVCLSRCETICRARQGEAGDHDLTFANRRADALDAFLELLSIEC